MKTNCQICDKPLENTSIRSTYCKCDGSKSSCKNIARRIRDRMRRQNRKLFGFNKKILEIKDAIKVEKANPPRGKAKSKTKVPEHLLVRGKICYQGYGNSI